MKKFVIILSGIASAASLAAQTPARPSLWFAQAFPFLIQYHQDFGYAPGVGIQLAAGRQFGFGIAGLVKFSHTRPRQPFIWLGESQTLKTNWYACQFALRWQWPRTSRLHFFAEAQAGAIFLRPHELTLGGGVQGAMVIAPPNEMKFSPALAVGASARLAPHLDAYLQFEIGGLRIAYRRHETPLAQNVWRPYRALGVGAAWRI